MATTTNYGWTTPDDTALVKDGAAAIRSLGTAIDTSMNTALGTKKAGLVLLNTTSFSAVSSQALPANTFSSTYDDYFIIVKFTGVSVDDADIYWRLRTGVTNAATNYKYERQYNTSSSIGSDRDVLGTTFFPLMNDADSALPNYNAITITMCRPALAAPTIIQQNSISESSAGGLVRQNFSGVHTTATAYDTMDLIVSTGNMTGSAAVFAYNK